MLSERERDKYRVAKEMGLMEKLMAVGWAGLTSQESGRIGGKLSGRARQKQPPRP